MVKRDFHRRAVVWKCDRRAAAAFAVLTMLVAAMSLAAGLLVRGFSTGEGNGEPVGLMAVRGLEEASADASGAEGKIVKLVRVDPGLSSSPVLAMPTPAVEEPVDAAEEARVPTVASRAQPVEPDQAEPAEAVRVEPPAPRTAVGDSETMMFDGRPLRKVKRMPMVVTAYSPDERSCGIWADGITASGYSVWTNGMKLVAADTRILPFGTIVTIPGYNDGRPVPVLDRGGAIKGNRLDVLYPTHEIALKWGVQRLDVTVWEYAD